MHVCEGAHVGFLVSQPVRLSFLAHTYSRACRDLSNNGISTIAADAFVACTELVALNLAANQLSALPESVFLTQTKLTTLDISSNAITALPDALFLGTRIKTLYADGNQLVTLPPVIFNNLNTLSKL